MKRLIFRDTNRTAWLRFSVVCAVVSLSGQALAGSDTDLLSQQLAEQRTLIEQQRQMIDQLNKRLVEVEKSVASNASPSAAQEQTAPPEETAKVASTSPSRDSRDDVGDLNAGAVRTGDFPGSFKIPGTRDVSLAIGGFVKAVGIADSNAEAMGADFLPATLGTKRADKEGAFSLDSTITRVFIDARAPLPGGSGRGYIEYDLNSGNDGSLGVKLRHAYGSWTTGVGTLTAGQTWSTLMDTKILPEGFTEPTVSGAIFARQSQIRWSQPLSSEWTYHVAIEDPSSNDFSSSVANVVGNTSLPDGVLGLEYVKKGVGHVRLNGMMRRLEVDGAVSDAQTAWGLTLTGHLDIGARDRLNLGGVYGKGLGRYLLGIQSSAGAVVDPLSGNLELRDNWGGIATYQHHWSDKYRSNLMLGYANSKPLAWQPGTTFENSSYGAVNLLWSPYPYVTLGVEYAYGKLENKDGSSLDNNRIVFGLQFF